MKFDNIIRTEPDEEFNKSRDTAEMRESLDSVLSSRSDLLKEAFTERRLEIRNEVLNSSTLPSGIYKSSRLNITDTTSNNT